jgi:hypothetical protein
MFHHVDVHDHRSDYELIMHMNLRLETVRHRHDAGMPSRDTFLRAHERVFFPLEQPSA